MAYYEGGYALAHHSVGFTFAFSKLGETETEGEQCAPLFIVLFL